MFKLVMTTILIVCCVTSVVLAHGVTLTGRVTEAKTDLPVPFATVQIEGSKHGTMADSVGNFQLSHIPEGKHTLVISAVGHETKRVAFAATAGTSDALAIRLRRTLIEVGGMVVTGTRTPRYIKDVPVFTEVVSKASIEDKSASNLFEALNNESGVRVEQQCQACNFSVLRMQGLGADHTQILLDGQPVYSGLAAVYGLQQMSTADIDQIEIVKGAGSALYGSNAIAGAINIVSAIPRTTEGTVRIEFGEHGTNRYDVSASTRKDKLGIFLFAQQNEQDELDETGDNNARDGVDRPDGWLDRVRSSGRNAGFNLYLDNTIAADQLIVRGRAITETRLGGWGTDDLFKNPFAPGTENISTRRYSGQIEYRCGFTNGAELNSSIAYTNHNRDATNDTFLGDYDAAYGTPPPVDLLRPYVADEHLITTNLNLMYPVATRHRLTSGLQYTHNRLKESGMYLDSDTQEPYRSASKKTSNEVGLYLQDEFKPSDRFEFVAGLRFDRHSSEDEFRGSGDVLSQGLAPLEYDESTVNPRFSLKYLATNAITLRSSIGTGYRVPYGFSEDLHLCSGSPRVYKGGDLRPEKSFSYSFTADYTARSFTASLNLYRTDLTNAIAFAEADSTVRDLGYSYEWRNVDDAYVMGAEVNSSIALATGLSLGLRFELFNGEYDHARADWLGTPYESDSRNIPRYPQVSGGLKLNVARAGWDLVCDADAKGKMFIDLTEPEDPADVKIHETESYVIINAKLSRTIAQRYQVYLGAKNLTDYTQEEKHISDAAFMYAPVYGRIVYAGVQVKL